MIAVTGKRSTIVQELERLHSAEEFVRMNLDLQRMDVTLEAVPLDVERYVLAAGVIHQKTILEQTAAEIIESLAVNMINVIRLCEHILKFNPQARICIVGSESAHHGSFDQTYAATKAAIHAYVKARKTRICQQLVCVSPPIISDSGMTMRRQDYPGVLEVRETVTAAEVARTIYRTLFVHSAGYLTGCIIPVIPQRKTANVQGQANENR